MKKLFNIFGQIALAAVFALVGVGTALAATPSSSMKVIDYRVKDSNLTLSYNVSGDGGTVSQVDLYLKRNEGNWQKVLTSYDTSAPFIINTADYDGDGTYAFYTIATLTSGEVENSKGVAEVVTVVDTTAPAAPDMNHLYINKSAADLTTKELSGHSLAVDPYGLVDVYSDAALTNKVASAGADENGAFGPVQVGKSASVWVVVTDRNDNRSAATKVTNVTSYGDKVGNLIAASYTGEMLDLSFDGVENATSYIIYYRHAGGELWSAMIVTDSTTPKLTGLDAGRAYDIRVAPMDADMNIGQYAFITTRTAGTRIDDVVLNNVAVGGDILSPVVVATATVSKAVPAGVGGDTVVVTSTGEVVTTDDTEVTTTDGDNQTSASVDNGDAKDATVSDVTGDVTGDAAGDVANEDVVVDSQDNTETAATDEVAKSDEEGSSATPWVILAILIILAGIATGGYFYWFSGPEEVTTTIKPDDKDEEDKRW